MIDKELEAIFKCHELIKDLDNDSKLRVFKYLLDRHSLVPDAATIIPRIEDNSNSTAESSEIIEAKESKDKSPKPAKKKSVAKPSATKSYSLISSMNLVSNGSESLKDFYGKYDAKNNFDHNILILYYLKRVIKESNIGPNHIYTCYKHLGIKVPNIAQSLRDTKSRKGWIDTSETEDLKVTVAGENYIEHEITTK